MTKNLPNNIYLVDKLITLNGLNVISGQSNAGKSWVVLDIAKAIATGSDLWGKFPTIQSNVLIIDGESGEREMKRRTTLMGFDHSLPISFLQMQEIKIDDKNTVKSLIEEAKNRDVKFIILDPFSAMHTKQENSAEEMQKVMEGLTELTKEGITVLFVHHHRKTNGNNGSVQMDNLRGSSVIVTRVDSQIYLKKEVEADSFVEICLSIEKLRNGKKINPFNLMLIDDEEGIRLNYSGENETKKLKREQAEELITDYLESGARKTSEIIEMLKQNDIAKRTGDEAFKQLKLKGTISYEKVGKEYVYSLTEIGATVQ